MKPTQTLIVALCALTLVGCSNKTTDVQTIPNQPTTMNAKLLNFEVTSYPNGSTIPAKFATKQGGGENVSIGVKWQPVPAAQSYALLFDDRAPIARGWTHWIVVDIPITTTEIPEGASRTDRMPAGSRELITSWGQAGYDGPQPPIDSGNHEYMATLFALDTAKLNLPDKPTRAELIKQLEQHEITREGWNGYFQR